MSINSNNLYKKIESLTNADPKLGDSLDKDQKTIVRSVLDMIEKDLAHQRKEISHKLKLNPFHEGLKREIDVISYNTLSIQHLRIKLGIKTSLDQGGQN